MREGRFVLLIGPYTAEAVEGWMARYKSYDLKQTKMIPLCYSDQLLVGSFEHALNEIVEEHLDMSIFERRYSNDATGRLAYDPKLMLKIVLYGYSRGILSSRRLEEACRRNIVFMALSDDTRPHFTTIAAFVSELGDEIVELFSQVLLICSGLGLLGRKHFALDGCRLSSNASKEWSGTHEELRERRDKLKQLAQKMVKRHRERDESEAGNDPVVADTALRKLAKLRKKIKKINEFLATEKERIGRSGKERKSNVTDPQSATMQSSHGVVQGFNGMAVVDEKHQIVVHAEAHGTGQEHEVLMDVVNGTRETFRRIGEENIFEKVTLLADAGLHSGASIEALEKSGVDAIIADPQHRKRDERFENQGRYKERHNKEDRRANKSNERQRFGPEHFIYNEEQQTCICPAGHHLYRSGRERVIDGYLQMRFKAPKTACRKCPLRAQCLRHPERTEQRQVAFFKQRVGEKPERAMDRMRRRFDSIEGRRIYSARIGIVEPVFANIRNKGMTRFTLRGKRKVDTQWKLYGLVQNIEKIAHYGKKAA